MIWSVFSYLDSKNQWIIITSAGKDLDFYD